MNIAFKNSFKRLAALVACVAFFASSSVAQEIAYLRDSTYLYQFIEATRQWVLTEKRIHKHNALGQKIETLTYAYQNGQNERVLTQRESYAYAPSGQLVGYEKQGFAEGEAFGIEKRLLEYHPTTGQQSSRIDYRWSQGAWVRDRKWETQFNEQGKATRSNASDWDGTQWLETYRFEYLLDPRGNRTEELLLLRDEQAGKLRKFRLQTYDYNQQDKIVKEISYRWNADTREWTPRSATSHEYAPSGKPIVSESRSWDLDSQRFLLSQRIAYTYKGELLSQRGEFLYQASSGKWIENTQNRFEYDEKGHLVRQEESVLDAYSLMLSNRIRTDFAFDGLDSLASRREWTWDADVQAWSPSQELLWHRDAFGNLQRESVSNFKQGNLYWQALQVHFVSPNDFSTNHTIPTAYLYPNPASDWLRVGASQPPYQLSLLDAHGRELLERTMNSTELELFVGQLETGTYLLLLRKPDTTELLRFVKL